MKLVLSLVDFITLTGDPAGDQWLRVRPPRFEGRVVISVCQACGSLVTIPRDGKQDRCVCGAPILYPSDELDRLCFGIVQAVVAQFGMVT